MKCGIKKAMQRCKHDAGIEGCKDCSYQDDAERCYEELGKWMNSKLEGK